MNTMVIPINTDFTELRFDPFSGPVIEQVMPPTMAQKEIWLSVQQGDDASCAFNEAMEISFDKRVDIDGVTRALNELSRRHSSLRSTFSSSGERLIVRQHDDTPLPVSECRPDSKQMDVLREAEVNTAFDLEDGPLWRSHLVLHEDSSTLFITFHHIVVDGWSLAVLFYELGLLYKQFALNEEVELPAVEKFTDYVTHLHDADSQTAFAEAEQYWLKQFAGPVPVLELPTDFTRPALRSYNSHRVDFAIPNELLGTLKKSAAKSGTTLFTWLLAAYNVFLYRISGQTELAIGIPAAGQSVTGMDYLVGHCVNMLPIRQSIPTTTSFADFLKDYRKVVLDAYDHQEFTFSQLLGKLDITRDRSHVPMLATTFNIDQESHKLDFGNATGTYQSVPRNFENFEWFYNLAVTKDSMTIECSYNRDLFTAETIKHRLSEFTELLASLAKDPTVKIEDTSLHSALDKQLLHGVNDTKTDYPNDRCVFQLFESLADSNGNKSAVVYEDNQYSYDELNRQANKLAHHLISQGTKAGDIIALYLNRNIEMLVALLAVQKTGACYLPLDPDYPADRIHYILDHAKATTVITESALNARLPDLEVDTLDLDTLWDSHTALSDANPGLAIEPATAAYVIYTSGSTGNPKGVLVSHRNVVNFLSSMQQTPGINAQDRLLAVTTLSFDIAVLELYLPLITGATVVVSNRETALDGNALSDLITAENITLMQATPATWRNLLAADWKGSDKLKALIGGEALPGDLITPLLDRVESLWNMYGPTETTVWSSCMQVKGRNQPIRIGSPIANTTLHLLDDKLRQVPVGCEGELYIGGDGVSIGYIHQPELTAERFIQDPFSSEPNARLYRTGDLCRIHSNGLLEYISRLDNQVKLRGYRIELGEIETTLAKHEDISQCITTVCEVASGDSRLIAYYSVNSRDPGFEDLRTWAKRSLPDYMVPQHCVCLEAFPQTPNGKIDRKALPRPDFGTVEIGEEKQPRSDTEKLVATSWGRLIGSASPAYSDNFFEIGGHSLLAMKFISEMQELYKVKIPLRSLLGDNLEQIALQINPNDIPVIESDESTGSISDTTSTSNQAAFLESSQGFIFTQMHIPVEPSARSHAVLICNPIGHEYMRSHRALQQLAQQLAKNGFHVLRFDYYGTGDSEGNDKDVNIETWQKDIENARGHLMRESACESLSIIGLRFGATLAASVPADSNDKLILWDPIVSGEGYIEQLRGMHKSMLRDLDRFRWIRRNAIHTVREELLGFQYSAEFQGAISNFEIDKIASANADDLISLHTYNSPESTALLSNWAKTFSNYRQFVMPDTCLWHDIEQIENALLPHDIQRKIVNLLTGKE